MSNYDDPYMDEPVDEERRAALAKWWTGVEVTRNRGRLNIVQTHYDLCTRTMTTLASYTCWPEMHYCSARANGLTCAQPGWVHHEDHDLGDEQ